MQCSGSTSGYECGIATVATLYTVSAAALMRLMLIRMVVSREIHYNTTAPLVRVVWANQRVPTAARRARL